MDAVELNRSNLSRLRPPVRVPAYDVARIAPGIVHLGLGGFHRAHMARYTHDLFDRDPESRGWAIVGAGLLPGDRRMHDSLAPQDWLYTLVERSGGDATMTVIGSLATVIFAGESSEALLAEIDSPAIRIVSLTVTENGYCLNPSTKRLDPEHRLIRQDLAETTSPHSAIGIIVEAFRRRREAGASAFTALSCDNIQHNGEVLREAVLTLARMRDPELAAWIERQASFPSTMVDRITPVTAPQDVEALERDYGIVDKWPVFSETFTQWVIEDRFVQGRPAWETVGAQFVDDVAPYEFMKLRLLNGSHLAVAGLGRLAGYTYIHEAMADERISRCMAALMDRETEPTLKPVPGVDLAAYKRTLIERFANPAIKDTVERVNTDAPINVLVDPIRDRIASGGDIPLLALALAAWLRRVRGEDEQGGRIDVRHPLAEQLRERAIEGDAYPRPLLGISSLFGELGTDPRVVEPVGRWLRSLYEDGSRATIERAAQTLRL